jgi:hypothetical protein
MGRVILPPLGHGPTGQLPHERHERGVENGDGQYSQRDESCGNLPPHAGLLLDDERE